MCPCPTLIRIHVVCVYVAVYIRVFVCVNIRTAESVVQRQRSYSDNDNASEPYPPPGQDAIPEAAHTDQISNYVFMSSMVYACSRVLRQNFGSINCRTTAQLLFVCTYMSTCEFKYHAIIGIILQV